jgi:hypothetical protein
MPRPHRVVIAEGSELPGFGASFRSSVVERSAAALARLLSGGYVAPLVSTRELDPAPRFLVGPLGRFLHEALLGVTVEVRRRAHAAVEPIVELFLAAVSPAPSWSAGRIVTFDGREASK